MVQFSQQRFDFMEQKLFLNRNNRKYTFYTLSKYNSQGREVNDFPPNDILTGKAFPAPHHSSSVDAGN